MCAPMSLASAQTSDFFLQAPDERKVRIGDPIYEWRARKAVNLAQRAIVNVRLANGGRAGSEAP